MPGPGGDANEFERLKSVLFSPEAARLAAAESQLEDLENWVGDAPRLEAATAEILVEAMRRAEASRHRELAAAIAPVVVAAIRAEISNSRDMMVEALYPLTGRLVTAAVSNAFHELLETINQRLEALLSSAQWRLRLRALVTGRSVAEIALAEARATTYERILLLERGSGRLLALWRPDGGHEDNPELVSGMVAAISEFASSVLSEHHGELRSLDLGASQVYLRASSRTILAAQMLGPANRRAQKRIDEGFVDLVARRDRGEEIGESDLAALARLSATPKAAARRSRLRLAVIAFVALAALAWGLKDPFYRWRKGREIDAAFDQALAANPQLSAYPLSLHKDWAAGTVTPRGLSNDAAATKRLLVQLTSAAAPLTVTPKIDFVATAAELEAARRGLVSETTALREGEAQLQQRIGADRFDAAGRIGNLEADLAALKLKLDKMNAEVATGLKGLKEAEVEARESEAGRLAQEIASGRAKVAAVEQSLAELQAALAGIRTSLAEPRHLIAEAAGAEIVFFGERDELADPDAAAKALDRLSAAISATGEGVRIVGYADESGINQGNIQISRQRAAKVQELLVARGVPLERLRSVGRGAQAPIVNATAEQQLRNRRVTFEPLFPLEEAP